MIALTRTTGDRRTRFVVIEHTDFPGVRFGFAVRRWKERGIDRVNIAESGPMAVTPALRDALYDLAEQCTDNGAYEWTLDGGTWAARAVAA